MEIVESEKRYRVLFDSLKEGVYQSGPTEDGIFTWINQEGAEILGYKSPEELIGMKVKDIYVNPDERKKIVEKLTKECVWRNFISLCKRNNGERFYMERTSNLVTDDKGKPTRIDGIFRDFTSYCKRKTGERFISERTSNLERDESGKPIRITGVFRDITER